MTTKTVGASGERRQRILGAVGFSPQGCGAEGNDQLYIRLDVTFWNLCLPFQYACEWTKERRGASFSEGFLLTFPLQDSRTHHTPLDSRHNYYVSSSYIDFLIISANAAILVWRPLRDFQSHARDTYFLNQLSSLLARYGLAAQQLMEPL